MKGWQQPYRAKPPEVPAAMREAATRVATEMAPAAIRAQAEIQAMGTQVAGTQVGAMPAEEMREGTVEEGTPEALGMVPEGMPAAGTVTEQVKTAAAVAVVETAGTEYPP